MQLCLCTDSVSNLALEEALDLASGFDGCAIELAVGEGSSVSAQRVLQLLEDRQAMASFRQLFASRGLSIAAVNCTGWALKSAFSEDFAATVRAAIHLASALEVDKLVTVSGCAGTPPTLLAIEWMTFAWPREYYKDLDAQWREVAALWRELVAEAAAHGIRSIALEFHPLQLVSNVPTLKWFRELVGPMVGATIDPGTMFWQQVDPISAIHALGPAVHHVHLKDVEVHEKQLPTAGTVLTTTPFEEPRQRAWTFRTVGIGRGDDFWGPLLRTLHDVGYDDMASISNKDSYIPQGFATNLAVRFVSRQLTKLNREVRQADRTSSDIPRTKNAVSS